MAKFNRGHGKSSKVNGMQVMEIWHRYHTGKVSQGQLAREYGLTIGSIGRIVRGETHQRTTALIPLEAQEMADRAAASQAKFAAMFPDMMPKATEPLIRLAGDIADARQVDIELEQLKLGK